MELNNLPVNKIKKINVISGISWVEIPEADVYIQCGCPADSVKHLMKQRLISSVEQDGVTFESGP
jgi:hemerythrin